MQNLLHHETIFLRAAKAGVVRNDGCTPSDIPLYVRLLEASFDIRTIQEIYDMKTCEG